MSSQEVACSYEAKNNGILVEDKKIVMVNVDVLYRFNVDYLDTLSTGIGLCVNECLKNKYE